MKKPIYCDYNATTPVDEQVLQAMLPYFREHFGNAASRTHNYGRHNFTVVEKCRSVVAEYFEAVKEEIIFTSGATEAINLAIKGCYALYKSKGNQIIAAATEHKAVLDTYNYLKKQGASISIIPVDTAGVVDLKALENLFTPQTILISVMGVNNETGVIQPIDAIADLAHKYQAIFLCDTTQVPGKVSFRRNEWNADLMCLSAHKFYGPKGIGALYVKRKNPRVRLEALIHGGGHEQGLRSGTLNVPGIVGMSKALQLVMENENERLQIEKLRNHFESGMLASGLVKVNGGEANRAGNVSSLTFKNHRAKELLLKLSEVAAVSTGSACSSDNDAPSHVLKAMGLSDYEAYCTLRFSFGRYNTLQEIDFLLSHLKSIL
jgi:cysteine desulfurase